MKYSGSSRSWQLRLVLLEVEAPGQSRCNWCITPGRDGSRVYGRLISNKAVRNSVVRTVLNVAWARFGSVKMKEIDEGTLAFDFENSNDKDRIMDLSL